MSEMSYKTKRRNANLICVLLALSTGIAYEPMRHNDFVSYDDNSYIVENAKVNGGLSIESVKWAFVSAYASNWHPVTWLSHIVDCELFGLNPLWHHAVNLLFHTANTLLLFWVLVPHKTPPFKAQIYFRNALSVRDLFDQAQS